MTTAAIAAAVAQHRGADESLPAKALGHVLTIAAVFCVVVALVVLIGFDGWSYYRTPLGIRGYHPAHAALRPSGTVGLVLGVTGVCFMLATLPYALRKRWRRLATLGRTKHWLEVHIFFGVVGPVLITFHTSFKFNGLISAGYWLMMVVWTSGFIGRYLYIRIPKSIRGTELSVQQVEQHIARLYQPVQAAALPADVRDELNRFHGLALGPDGAPGALDLFFGELRLRVRLAIVRRHLSARGIDVPTIDALITAAAERATLTRRLAHLQRTRHLFELWHVFHRPLVFAMFLIVAVHVGIALYLGYITVLP